MQSFGPYRVVREVGRGGMGAIFEVAHPDLPRRLALKLIHEQLADEEALLRFEREARLLAQVRHRNVLVVHELGRSSSGPFLVTDLVEGETLRARVARGPLPARDAALVVRDVADAVATLHASGILHRDLKPDNVMLQPDGTPILLDFGLARELAGDKLTMTGTVLGTPVYMSPEQAQGAADERSDVYGLGVVLYVALAARPPFEAKTHLALLTKVMNEAPPWPAETDPSVPAELDAICRMAMAKAAGERYAMARDLKDDLDRFLRGRPTIAARRLPELVARERRARARRLALLAAPPLAVLALVIIIVALAFGRDPDLPGVGASSREAPRLTATLAGEPLEGGLRLARGARGELSGTVRARGQVALVVSATGGVARASVSPGPFSLQVPLAAGENVVSVTATDGEGLASSAVEARVLRWDWAPAPDARPPLPFPAGLAPSATEGEYVNALDGSRLVWVPPGAFAPTLLGPREVTPASTPVAGFYMGKLEVSWEQLRAFCAATGRAPPDPMFERAHGTTRDMRSHPAFCVSWDEATAYAAWAGLRLPTDVEWEFASRGPDPTRQYPWGTDPPAGRCNLPGEDDRYPFTSPGGAFPTDRSWCGCLDLAGNVGEWVQDWLRQERRRDWRGVQRRIVRGGCWQEVTGATADELVRSTFNLLGREPGERLPSVGLRVARDAR